MSGPPPPGEWPDAAVGQPLRQVVQVDGDLDILHRLVRRSSTAVAGMHKIGVEQRLVDAAEIDGADAEMQESGEVLNVAQQADRRSRAAGCPIPGHVYAQTGEHVLLCQPPRDRIGDAGEVEPVVAVARVHPEDGGANVPEIVTEAGKLRAVDIIPDRNAAEHRLVVAVDGRWQRRLRRMLGRARHHGAPASGGR
ncbi:hypothetical protein NKL05_31920 [Mesorhizobium sp. C420B]|uniref:hypothetical protein n=1 Tax=Mesorhizobium sp. C420B TaxID=2956835 RepID=UPI003339E69F